MTYRLIPYEGIDFFWETNYLPQLCLFVPVCKSEWENENDQFIKKSEWSKILF